MAWSLYRSGLYLGQPLTPGSAQQGIAIAANYTMQVMIQVPTNTTLKAYCSTYNDVTTYFATADYGVNSSTGAPTSYVSSGTNSSYQATYSNGTGSTVTVYIYIREAFGQAVAQSSNTLIYSFASYTPTAAWVGVTATLNVPTSAGNSATTSIASLAAGNYLNATFTPTVTGTYQCWSQFAGDAYMFIGPTSMTISSTNGAVTGATTSNDDGANNAFGNGNYGSNQPFCEISLTANTTYRMIIRHYSATSSPTSAIGAGTVYIGLSIWHRTQNISSTTALTGITAGTDITLTTSTISIPGTYYVYPFTVDTSGEYSIWSEATSGYDAGDTYGYLHSSSTWFTQLNGTSKTPRTGSWITSDDQNGGNNQYKMVTNLTAGTTYYLYHSCWQPTGTSSNAQIKIRLTPPKAYLASYVMQGTSWGTTQYPSYLIGKGSVQNTFVNPTAITTINFVQSYTPTGTELGSWDASESVNGSVTAYALSDGVTVTVAGNGGNIYGKSNFCLLYNMHNVATITGCDCINASEVTTLFYTFMYYQGTSIPSGVSNWDTGNVTTCYGPFYGCSNVSSISINWDCRNATSMSSFFCYCSNLQYLYIQSLNTTNCTSLSDFFAGCTKLFEIRVGSQWDRRGNGSSNLINFPNPSSYTGSVVPTDMAIGTKWRDRTTGVEYEYTDIPNRTNATYSIFLSDGRPTLGCILDSGTSTETRGSITVDGTSYYVPYWLRLATTRTTGITGAMIRAITEIETRDTYTPNGSETGSWDASLTMDGRVHAYMIDTKVIIAGNGSGYIDCAKYASYVFGYLPNLTKVIAPHLNLYNPTGTNFSSSAKTYQIYYPFAFSYNVEEIDISGLDFRNTQNYYWYFYAANRTSSNGVYTTTLLTKLSKLTVGAGYKKDCAGPVPIPTSGITVVPSDGSVFDGSWHDELGTTYTEGSYNSDGTITAPSFPNYTAHTYTAYIPPAPATHSVWKYYNGSSWVTAEAKYYDGSTWVKVVPKMYNGTEWK